MRIIKYDDLPAGNGKTFVHSGLNFQFYLSKNLQQKRPGNYTGPFKTIF